MKYTIVHIENMKFMKNVSMLPVNFPFEGMFMLLYYC